MRCTHPTVSIGYACELGSDTKMGVAGQMRYDLSNSIACTHSTAEGTEGTSRASCRVTGDDYHSGVDWDAAPERGGGFSWARPASAIQFPTGSLQQSPAAAGSLAPASRTTFQLPFGCLRQMVI